MNADRSEIYPTKPEVKALLQKAFPGLITRPDLKPSTHEDLLEMRMRLPAVSDRDLPFAMREVLDDLLETHTGRFADNEDADMVLLFLDVFGRRDYTGVEESFGEDGLAEAREGDEFVIQSTLRSFQSFTPEQALAIQKWLEHARDWPEFKLHLQEIDSALTYWRERAKRTV